MAAGYPVKVNYLTGDVLTAADLNDLAGTVNLYDPTAKGDLFPATAADAVSRLAVGANDTVLTADSATATGLKWAAAAAAGSMTLLSTTAITASASMSITNINQTYTDLLIEIENGATANTAVDLRGTFNTLTTGIYSNSIASDSVGNSTSGQVYFTLAASMTSAANTNKIGSTILIRRYTNTVSFKTIPVTTSYVRYHVSVPTDASVAVGAIGATLTAAITSIQLFPASGNWTAQGNIYVYGVN